MIGLAIGLPKHGKTQVLQDYVNAHALQNRFFWSDKTEDTPRDSYRWRGTKWKDWNPRLARVLRFAGITSLPVATDRPWFGDAPPPGPDALRWAESLPTTGVFRFGYPWTGLEVAQLAVDVGNVTIVDDEIDFMALHAGWNNNPLREVCHRGRHLPNRHGVMGEVHVLGAMRRPQNCHIDLTTLADFVWMFRTRGFRTLQRLVDDSLIQPEELEQVKSLPKFHYRLWTVDQDQPVWGRTLPVPGAPALTEVADELGLDPELEVDAGDAEIDE